MPDQRTWPLRELRVAPGLTQGRAHLFLYSPLGVLYDFLLDADWTPFNDAETRWVQENYEYPARLMKAAMRSWNHAGRQTPIVVGFNQTEPVPQEDHRASRAAIEDS